jgi:hypothetical protein
MKKFIKIFFLDLLYFSLFLIIIFLSRAKIQKLFANIQSYTPQLNLINSTIENQNLISQINSQVTYSYLFIFILIPLLIFAVYILLQGCSFYILKKEKNHFVKFTLVSLPTFIFFTLLMFNYNFYLLIITLLSSYYAFYSYYKNNLKLILRKSYKYFPLCLAYLILSLLSIIFLFLSFLSISTKTNYILIFISLAIIFLFSYYKIFLIKLFN